LPHAVQKKWDFAALLLAIGRSVRERV
jgi:hypothetical protein